jgi:hypothetical protein
MSPDTTSWWEHFLLTHGRDSTEEASFLGYLTTHDIAPHGSVEELDQAYAAFEAWMITSGARQMPPTPLRGGHAAPMQNVPRAVPPPVLPVSDKTPSPARAAHTPSIPTPPASPTKD